MLGSRSTPKGEIMGIQYGSWTYTPLNGGTLTIEELLKALEDPRNCVHKVASGQYNVKVDEGDAEKWVMIKVEGHPELQDVIDDWVRTNMGYFRADGIGFVYDKD